MIKKVFKKEKNKDKSEYFIKNKSIIWNQNPSKAKPVIKEL